MEYTAKIIRGNEITEKKVNHGTKLLNFLHDNRIYVNSYCNGNKTCGKCRVRVDGLSNAPGERERKLLGDSALAKGFRLACYNNIDSDIDIYIEEQNGQVVEATEGKDSFFKIEPIVSKHYVSLDLPDIDDQRALLDRVLTDLKGKTIDNSIQLLRDLPNTLNCMNFEVTFVSMKKKVIAIESGNTTGRLFGAAFDIGTTTVVGYLVDLIKGDKICTISVMNPQRLFGADVISRIKHTMESQESRDEINRLIIDCINDILLKFTIEKGIEQKDIYIASFVGNTTMMHFLMNIPAAGIAVSPFIPVTTDTHKFKADDMGVNINRNGYCLIFPSVSAYIGADTVSAVFSSGMQRSKSISLMVDIGTNGEIVLGNNKWLYSCSTAAGPAFEGANIRNGTGGVEGAIDSVSFKPEFKISTIGDKSAVGICGSGVVDAVAGMYVNGICDKSGRILDPDETDDLDTSLKGRLTLIDGMKAFLLIKNEDCAADTDIAITQKDVREVQNAKAAIAAGIKILAEKAGIKLSDIEKVYLAGGFGSYMNIDNALNIGLIPDELKGKVVSIGNAAGIGATQGLLSTKMLKKADEIKKRIEYVELSASEEFMSYYIECMGF